VSLPAPSIHHFWPCKLESLCQRNLIQSGARPRICQPIKLVFCENQPISAAVLSFIGRLVRNRLTHKYECLFVIGWQYKVNEMRLRSTTKKRYHALRDVNTVSWFMTSLKWSVMLVHVWYIKGRKLLNKKQ